MWQMANWCNLHAGYMESHFCMLLYTLEDTFFLNNNVLDYFALFLLVRSCSYLVFSIFVEIEPSPVRCLVSEVTATACGADFTVWLSSVEGASILYGL